MYFADVHTLKGLRRYICISWMDCGNSINFRNRISAAHHRLFSQCFCPHKNILSRVSDTYHSWQSLPLLLLLASCATTGTAPVVNRVPDSEPTTAVRAVQPEPVRKASASQSASGRRHQGYHVVVSGETLYSIAWNYGFDYRNVAAWNGITTPYTIYPGQVIRLKPPPETATAVVQPGPVISRQPGPIVDNAPAAVKPSTPQPVEEVVENKTLKGGAVGQTDQLAWHWPVQGKILRSGSLTSKKGVDIAGRLGQDIKAAAQGDVVYSGSGLLGYGRLIIIKHNETFLSAYAHNSELLVKEGDSVSTGQVIARMGTNSSGQAQLHFEIRKNGKSVNPLTLLPRS